MQASPWDPESVTTVLDAQGRLTEGAEVGGLDVRAFYKRLVAARILDLRLSRLGLPLWASSAGEEAPVVATAGVARMHEWIYPGARDTAVALARGLEPAALVDQVLGRGRGGGAALPGRVASHDLRIATTTDALGVHLAIAAGQAHAAKLGEGNEAVFALFGEGLTTTGIFHETVALAVRSDLPLVLVCRSQLWPDEAPPEAGLFGDSVQERAAVCGLWSRRVDGADPIAVWNVIGAAAERARAGSGPALVEAVVTPMVHDPPPHRDPVERLRRHLDSQGQWTETFQDVVEAETRQAIQDALAANGWASQEGEA
ncbi:MAG: thiamine pyrophosphate-dependent enzyme [Myxococcota bacterium]